MKYFNTVLVCLILFSCTKPEVNPYGPGKGRVSIWTQIGYMGDISVTIDGEVKYIIENWDEDGPSCDDPGAANFNLSPGRYSYEARTADGTTWQGEIESVEGRCTQLELSIGSPTSAGFTSQGEVILKSRSVRIALWDHATIDGDRLRFVFNGRTINPNLTINGSKVFYTFSGIPNGSWIGIIALSEGSISPCTPAVEVDDGFSKQTFFINSYVSGVSGSYSFKIVL
jgi:hypothetical protein